MAIDTKPTVSPGVSVATLLAALTLAGCSPQHAAVTELPIASWKMVRECPDGEWVYRLKDGRFAVAGGDLDQIVHGHLDGHWDILDRAPDDYCATTAARATGAA